VPGGVQVLVEDVDAALAKLKAAGVRLVNETPVDGAGDCRVAFVHPASTGGILLELSERKKGRRAGAQATDEGPGVTGLARTFGLSRSLLLRAIWRQGHLGFAANN
jgi:hypothetical protein